MPVAVEETNSGNYIVVFDPIDGSANIDTSLTTGSIFGIYSPDEQCLIDIDSEDSTVILLHFDHHENLICLKLYSLQLLAARPRKAEVYSECLPAREKLGGCRILPLFKRSCIHTVSRERGVCIHLRPRVWRIRYDT